VAASSRVDMQEYGFMNAVRPAISENPFGEENSRIYAPNEIAGGSPSQDASENAVYMGNVYKGARDRLAATQMKLQPAERESIEKLYDDGMRVNSFGVNLKAVAKKRGPRWLKSTHYSGFTAQEHPSNGDPDLDLAYRLLLGGLNMDDSKCITAQWLKDNTYRYNLPTNSGRPGSKKGPARAGRGARRRRSVHQEHWRQRMGRQGSKIHDFVRGLREDGFVYYDNILDPVSLEEAWQSANRTLTEDMLASPGHSAMTHVTHPVGVHRRTDRFVCHEALKQLAKQYLGSASLFETMRLQRLKPGELSPEDHLNVVWHRSRVGRKLLVVVFLDHPEVSDRGIQVVRGSHDLHYYTSLGRHYTDEAVEREFNEDIVTLEGRPGTALLLDGNILRRDLAQATLQRDVIILEFVDWSKYQMMAEMGCAQMTQDDYDEKSDERDTLVHEACPSPVLHFVQRNLKAVGLPQLGIAQSVIGFVIGMALILFFIFTQMDTSHGPRSEVERRRMILEQQKKKVTKRPNRHKSTIQDLARKRNAGMSGFKRD